MAASKSWVDSPFTGGIFTFLIGAKKMPFELHPAAVKAVSEPLGRMMENGAMQESLSRCCEMKEVDVETFALFAEYVYKGNYCAGKTSNPVVAGENFRCYQCGAIEPLGSLVYYPFCSEECREVLRADSGAAINCTQCGESLVDDELPYTCSELSCKCEGWRMLSLSQNRYGMEGMSHEVLSEHLVRLEPADKPTTKVAVHAKLWVFASQYMVNPLQELCLHKLHRDLIALDLNNKTVSKFIELIEYADAHTTNNKDGNNGVGSTLRDLVVIHTAWKAKGLASSVKFEEMLGRGCELAAESVTRALKMSRVVGQL